MSTQDMGDSYLPDPLKDFHDQKDVFKAIWDCYMSKIEESDGAYIYKGLNWCNAQCFVIDKFLHFMATHGWKMQRWRKGMEYHDLDETIEECRKKRVLVMREMG